MTAIKALFFGISTIDCIYLVDFPPGRNEKIVAHRQMICAGGPSTNAAITFSALGGNATLVSCLGRHPLTMIVRDELKTYGVDHIDLCPEFASIPVMSSIFVIKSNGDRSVISSTPPLSLNRFPGGPSLSLDGFAVALFDGQQMKTAIALARKCRRAGIHTILDGGSWKPGTEELIHHIDSAICSSNFTPPGATSLGDTLEWLHDHRVSRAAVTRGDQSILATKNGNRFEIFPPKRSPVHDTLAAGDIFHGAYAYYYSKDPGGKFREHLQKAAAIAAKACTYFGPRKWIDDILRVSIPQDG